MCMGKHVNILRLARAGRKMLSRTAKKYAMSDHLREAILVSC